MIAPRRQGVEYSVEHHGHRFLILHNDDAEDFALAYTSADAPGDWVELIPAQPGTRLESVDSFAAARGRLACASDGLTGLRVMADGSTDTYDMEFPEPLYSVGLAANPEYDTQSVRISYTSLVTPDSVYDVDLVTRAMTLRKQKPVLGRLPTRTTTSSSANGRSPTTAPGCRSPSWPAEGRPADGSGAAAALRLRLVRDQHRPVLLHPPAVAARPRRRLSPSRTSAAAASWVADGTRTARCWPRRTRSPTSWRAPRRVVKDSWTHGGPAGGARRLGRRPADGRDRQPGARGVRRHRGPGPVRGPAELHPGPVAAADRHRVGGVGQPARVGRGVRLHEVVQPVRERIEAPISEDPGRDQPQRHPGAVPRAGQVDRQAAGDRPRPGRTC